MIKSFWIFLKRKKENFVSYFTDTHDEIETANIKILKSITIVLDIAIVVFMVLTMVTLPGWRPSIFHYIFLCFVLLFSIIAVYLNKHRSYIKGLEKLICATFMLGLMIFIGILDAVPSPQTNQIFIGIFIVAASVIFIVPFKEMVFFQLLFMFYFIVMTFYFKPLDIAKTDTLEAFLAFVTSFVIYQIVMNIRINDYQQKYNYKLSS